VKWQVTQQNGTLRASHSMLSGSLLWQCFGCAARQAYGLSVRSIANEFVVFSDSHLQRRCHHDLLAIHDGDALGNIPDLHARKPCPDQETTGGDQRFIIGEERRQRPRNWRCQHRQTRSFDA